MSHYRCLVWAALGGLLGVAMTAHGQEVPVAPGSVSGGGVDDFLRLVNGGGLPAVLAMLAWAAGRIGGVPVMIHVHPDTLRALHPDDKE